MAIANPLRAAAVDRNGNLWKSGEPLRFMFVETYQAWDAADKDVVREAFQIWQTAANGGLDLQETTSLANRPQIRIDCDRLDVRGTFSRLGVEATKYPLGEKTMNFTRGLTDAEGRAIALHEAGHALGFRHEHQNSVGGIEWDTAAVYEHFAFANGWSSRQTKLQVLDQFAAEDFGGRPWDPDSIMNYGFPKGLINNPARYRTQPLPSPVKLSAEDVARLRYFYPPLSRPGEARLSASSPAAQQLKPFESLRLSLKSDEQAAYLIVPEETRKYTITTVGEIDSSISLYEQTSEGDLFLGGDEDGGTDKNALLETRLIAGRKYTLRLRVLYATAPGYAAVMLY